MILMNKNEFILLRELNKKNLTTQRDVAKCLSVSLGLANKLVSGLKTEGYLEDNLCITQKGKEFLDFAKPKNAIILAAGYGLRMVPINQNKPKALLTVDGVPLIERQIEQLNAVGITDITVVVGYMKETFEYLIDKYGVQLVYNKDYACKNNLYSISCVLSKISNTYIVPCDMYCAKNPFNKNEYYTWYMVNELIDDNSSVRITKNNLLSYIDSGIQTIITTTDLKNVDERILKKAGLFKVDNGKVTIIEEFDIRKYHGWDSIYI